MKFELNIPTENYDDFLLISKLLQDLIKFKANKINIGFVIGIDYIKKEKNNSPKPQALTGRLSTQKDKTTTLPVADKPHKKKEWKKRNPGIQKDFNGYNIRCKKCGQGKPKSDYKGTWRICKECRKRKKEVKQQ